MGEPKGKKMYRRRLVRAVFWVLTCLSLLYAQQPGEREIRAVRTDEPVRVDGKLDDQAWQKAEMINDLVQREPQEGEPGSEATEIRILYDDEYLYIGVICSDSRPDKIVASEMRRDAPLQDND